MMLRIARAFITRRFVERQIRFLAILPTNVIDMKLEGLQGIGRNRGVRTGAHRSADKHAPIRDQRAALPARAETLRKKNTFEIHRGVVWRNWREGRAHILAMRAKGDLSWSCLAVGVHAFQVRLL